LAFPAQPLAFWDEWDTIAFLVYRQIASIAEHDGICILAITIVADCTFTVLFFARLRLTINSRRRT
jgi:hypothetical protein